jgi:hypothetical protein
MIGVENSLFQSVVIRIADNKKKIVHRESTEITAPFLTIVGVDCTFLHVASGNFYTYKVISAVRDIHYFE